MAVINIGKIKTRNIEDTIDLEKTQKNNPTPTARKNASDIASAPQIISTAANINLCIEFSKKRVTKSNAER